MPKLLNIPAVAGMTLEIDPAGPVVEQLETLMELAEANASHLFPETVTGVFNGMVLLPTTLSVKLFEEPIKVVGAVPRPLSS